MPEWTRIADADTFQLLAMRTAGGYTTVRELQLLGALGLAGEGGEVVDLVKKDHFHPHRTISPKDIEEELGDMLWYAAILAESYGFTLGDAMARCINKLQERYPNGFPEVTQTQDVQA